ncbi:MAG: hypothetical protein ILP10_01550 [Lachnospiraceae bacterium]|nr:hypothetical protein [Lachnospiraceae bacterium]
MKEKNEAGGFKINIGAPSIILLLVVFALTVFALLSIRASYNELKLARTSRESVDKYYKALGEAERSRAQIDAARTKTGSDSEAFARELAAIGSVTETEGDMVTYRAYVDDDSWITVKLDYSGGEGRVASHMLEGKPLEGYNASPFDILDPIWIELDEDEDVDSDDSFWVDDAGDESDEDDDEISLEDIIVMDQIDDESGDGGEGLTLDDIELDEEPDDAGEGVAP